MIDRGKHNRRKLFPKKSEYKEDIMAKQIPPPLGVGLKWEDLSFGIEIKEHPNLVIYVLVKK